MNKVAKLIKWIRANFFYLTIALFIFLYIWWFRLNPIVFGLGEQASDPFIFGLFLLIIYGFTIGILKLSKFHSYVKALSLVMAILFLVINTVFVIIYLPQIKATGKFGGNTYYITSNFPFLDCCGYHQITKWQGIFHYESNFFGYNLPPVKFIYDSKMDEVSLVDISGDSEELYETFGKSPRYYEGYAQLENHLYYVSTSCNLTKENLCGTYTYVLYQCELDNTLCTGLPMEYTGDDGSVNLQVNESTKEIDFYLEPYPYNEPGILIYTYGQPPRCFVNGCYIIK